MQPENLTDIASSAPGRNAIDAWLDRQDDAERARIAERIRRRTHDLQRRGLGRGDDAGALALFLEFADSRQLTPAEAASLLEDPGAAASRARDRIRSQIFCDRGAGSAARRSRDAERDR